MYKGDIACPAVPVGGPQREAPIVNFRTSNGPNPGRHLIFNPASDLEAYLMAIMDGLIQLAHPGTIADGINLRRRVGL